MREINHARKVSFFIIHRLINYDGDKKIGISRILTKAGRNEKVLSELKDGITEEELSETLIKKT